MLNGARLLRKSRGEPHKVDFLRQVVAAEERVHIHNPRGSTRQLCRAWGRCSWSVCQKLPMHLVITCDDAFGKPGRHPPDSRRAKNLNIGSSKRFCAIFCKCSQPAALAKDKLSKGTTGFSSKNAQSQLELAPRPRQLATASHEVMAEHEC